VSLAVLIHNRLFVKYNGDNQGFGIGKQY